MRYCRWLPLLTLAACAQAPAAPDPTIWIGRSEADLVAALGVPSRSYEAEGRRFIAYETAGGSSAPAVVPSIGFGVGSFGGGRGGGTAVGTGVGLSFLGGGGGYGPCVTTYELRDSLVIGATRQGC